ncbi:hypothetical protein FIBSPDRAFT_502591 [Athelia psychrophila]|uniref:Uncharacterized protein n=1 Tax=Athelia psychrophila TaxID=1759441 RepID=A0A166K4P0_9AGAM|nr:hypothetical protein FIBSPDRAFT_502591 [Fibularhizoctonia sp. CBS 109695]
MHVARGCDSGCATSIPAGNRLCAIARPCRRAPSISAVANYAMPRTYARARRPHSHPVPMRTRSTPAPTGFHVRTQQSPASPTCNRTSRTHACTQEPHMPQLCTHALPRTPNQQACRPPARATQHLCACSSNQAHAPATRAPRPPHISRVPNRRARACSAFPQPTMNTRGAHARVPPPSPTASKDASRALHVSCPRRGQTKGRQLNRSPSREKSCSRDPVHYHRRRVQLHSLLVSPGTLRTTI